MALDNPVHRIDTVNLEQEKPVLPWQSRDFDGFEERNEHERALGDRDALLLDLLRALKQRGVNNISPLYPFREDATLVPSTATATDAAGAPIPDFTIDPTALRLSNSFIRDLKVVLVNEFSLPFMNRLVLRKAVDPISSLVQIFIDVYFSARYTGDQEDHEVLSLTSKAFNDVQDNSVPSSRDGLAFNLKSLEVDTREWLTSGVITFGFLGSVHSALPKSWSVGLLSGATVEGFSMIPALAQIEFTFTRPAAGLTELAYTHLSDLRKAIPFLQKILYYPFDKSAAVGATLCKYVTDLTISGPGHQRTYLKRIRKATVAGQPEYTFLFAYDERDSDGNYLATVNTGVAKVTQTSGNAVKIFSLGSNRLGGADPDWLDEVQGQTVDSFGVGVLTVKSWADMALLYDELLGVPVGIGSPSPIDVSPIVPGPVVGLFVDPDVISMVEGNSIIDTLCVSVIGVNLTVNERPLGVAHATRNLKVSVAGVVINRRTCYGPEAIMRDFYGIPGTESLTDNDKIPLEDEWFDTTANVLKRYQLTQGKRRWRSA